jgi:dTDP-4-amino-4,6-dideoxygalactose transaminase
MNPHEVTRIFEREVAAYCGSRYAVAVNSCTAALLICCAYHKVEVVEIPKLTYVGVAQSIINAGGKLRFKDLDWQGAYRLEPYPIVDAARRFHAGMHRQGDFTCISLHISKILGVDQGGVILHDDSNADQILRRMRFDGRTEGLEPQLDTFVRGFHCYLSPTIAAQALWKLSTLPRENVDLPRSDYADLSIQPVFMEHMAEPPPCKHVPGKAVYSVADDAYMAVCQKCAEVLTLSRTDTGYRR